jgi:hypothetical protein
LIIREGSGPKSNSLSISFFPLFFLYRRIKNTAKSNIFKTFPGKTFFDNCLFKIRLLGENAAFIRIFFLRSTLPRPGIALFPFAYSPFYYLAEPNLQLFIIFFNEPIFFSDIKVPPALPRKLVLHCISNLHNN